MLHLDPYTPLKNYELNELPRVLEEGRHHVLLHEAGLIQRRSFSCQVCRSLWRLGHALVTAGRWLERRRGGQNAAGDRSSRPAGGVAHGA